MHARLLVTSAFVVLCAWLRTPSPARLAVQGQSVAGTYRLVAVGGRDPQYWGRQGGCDVPTYSLYTFEGTHWSNVDTIRSVGECKVAVTDSFAVRRDSGYFRIARDTLNLYVADTMIGLKGWVLRMFIRGDTLVFRAGEFDPGDYVYVRRRR